MSGEIINNLIEFGYFLFIVTLYVLKIGYSFILIKENGLNFKVGFHLFVIKFFYVLNSFSKILVALLKAQYLFL